MRLQAYLLLWAICIIATCAVDATWKIRNEIVNDPTPNPTATVVIGNVRFTVLTPQLLRLEISLNSAFVDEASLWVLNRNLTVPQFDVKTSGDVTVINTGSLELIYNKGIDNGQFTQRNLNISFPFNGSTVLWYPGLVNVGNLNGTRNSLDCYATDCQDGMPLDPGLISTDGWVVLDDSVTPLWNYSVPDGIPWLVSPSVRNDTVDWYFFGYGWDFKQLLFDYTQIAGPIAIPPTSAFGTWWSRYWAYSEAEITNDIILGYKNHSLPLNHLVLDMDWHIETNDKQCQSWGGYTWNQELFPNPQGFIDYVHSPENQLKLLLNIHPQTGVDVCQSEYYNFAKSIGFDTSTNATIQCDFVSREISSNQFTIVMDPIGNDYWWTDYGGCSNGENIPTQYNMLWTNYVFDQELAAKGIRPLVLSRFGGPGNHRYPVGFSGDTYSVWPTLAFEVYMTPTAANILFGYWSHDTGGFHNEPSDEMFLRWLQFASVEPIYRIHSDHQERRIWMFPSYESMKQTMIFRNSIGPYIYTQARRSYDTGVSIVHPLYYDFPALSQAYTYQYQYMFGEDIFAAPVVTQGDNSTNTTSKEIWLPPGQWFDYNAMKLLNGPSEMTIMVPFSQTPIYVRAGAVVPMKDMQSVTNYNPDPLIFAVFPGAISGNCSYYEDDGNSTQYLNGAYSFTSVVYATDTSGLTKVIINPPQGSFNGQPTSRTFQVVLVSASSPKSATFSTSTTSVQIPQVAPGTSGLGWWQGDLGLTLQSPANTVVQEANSFQIQF